MTTRERIEVMIKKAKDQREIVFGEQELYWNGYIAFGNELKLTVKPKEQEP